MNLRTIFSKGVAICFLLGVAWFAFSMFWGFRVALVGAEYSPAEEQPWLAGKLEEHFQWSDLPPGSVERVWANGFQDHIRLFRIRLAPSVFASLRHSVLAKQGESVRLEDRDDPTLCPFGFATKSPQGPDGMRLPAWWEAASLRHFDGLLWDNVLWGFWFGYDANRELLFLLVHDL